MATKANAKKANTESTIKKKAGAKRGAAKSGTDATPKGDAASAGKSKPAKSNHQKRASGLDLAADVLAKVGAPLNAKSIAERVIAAGWKTSGLTPHATLFAAIHREIAKKGKDSRFKKVGRGQFAINDARATK